MQAVLRYNVALQVPSHAHLPSLCGLRRSMLAVMLCCVQRACML